MRRYWPSMLILRKRPRYRRPLKAWEAWIDNAQRDHRIARAMRIADRWERSEQMRHDDILIRTSDRTQMRIVQQGQRDLIARVDGIESREVPGHDAETKLYQSNLVIEHDETLDDHEARIRRVERAVGEQPDA